jgi:rhamnogalacturonyl hydrolase YesR
MSGRRVRAEFFCAGGITVNRFAIAWMAVLLTGCMNGGSSKVSWGEFPQNANPRQMGQKAVLDLIHRPTMASQSYGVIYPEVCSGYGALRFAGAIGDKELVDQLVARYQGMLNTEGGTHAPPAAAAGGGGGRGRGGRGRGAATQAGATTQPGAATRGGRGGGGRGQQGIAPKDGKAVNMIPIADHVDHSVFGVLPIEIYRQTGDARYLEIGRKSADDQWANPMPEGLTNQSRFWIDDMFMVIGLQTQAYRGTKDPIYLDHAAKEMSAYLDKLQQPNGLFYHADDAQFYWGRGNGWVAAGLAELLSELPEKHPQRARIMEGYQKMMAALLKYQAPDGMWRQLIDNDKSWAETSGTGMFTFAMATGVKRGWLDAKVYKEPTKRAWTALCGYVNEDGKVREVCVGTNKGYTVEYYMDRGRVVGDLHGQAGFMWAAWAMLD